MTLELNLQGADLALVLPALQDVLFFHDASKALAGLPTPLTGKLPYDINPPKHQACSCSDIFKSGQWSEAKISDTKFSPPKVKFGPDPEFSEQARAAKVSGLVKFSFYVTEAGRVEDIWLLRPIGFGLDENALAALRQYTFRPGQYDGTPVGTELRIEIAFERFD